ncbi:MAG: hypothetical protein U0556_12155 [Dehalococcoidia bacterium]
MSRQFGLLLCWALLAACQPVQSTPPAEAPARLVSERVASPAALDVHSRHSEDATIGELAGLLVSIDNRSTDRVGPIRIDVSSDYFDGLELRATDPKAIQTEVGPAGYSFVFDGPRPGVRNGYLIVLIPRREGEYPAEVTVSVVGADRRENLLAIYDISTRVNERPSTETVSVSEEG